MSWDHCWCCKGLSKRLGIDEVLHRAQSKHPRLGLSLRQTVFSLAVSRLIRPSSKLAVYEQLLGSLYPALAGAELKLHQFYRTLDVLAAAKDDIEVSLFAHGRDLFTSRVDVVLYDLTTLRFESTQQTEQLRRFGYSKERRNDCTQVVLGWLVDTHGIPLGFEVYPGNTMEGKTLTDIVHKLCENFFPYVISSSWQTGASCPKRISPASNESMVNSSSACASRP